MIVFPNCKLNLGLHITGKRADGYHNLETVFIPLNIQDALEIIPIANAKGFVEFTTSGLTINGDGSDNLCVKAYHLLQKQFTDLPAIQMHLHKAIPMGAGLGGGSADGAFALQLLNQLFNLQLNTAQLLEFALELGSDCPFFILNKPCFATGRGELMTPLELDMSAYKFVVVNPGIHISTAWAFAQIKPALPKYAIQEIIRLPIQQWKESLMNDFEAPVTKAHPAIAAIKEQLYHKGALYAAMSGSGSTIFGIFEKNTMPFFDFPKNYWYTIAE